MALTNRLWLEPWVAARPQAPLLGVGGGSDKKALQDYYERNGMSDEAAAAPEQK